MEDDPELAALREQRLAQMKAQFAGQAGGGGPGGGPGGPGQQNSAQEAAERRAKEEELRNTILAQVLTQEARARLSTLEAAKPGKAKMVENIIIQNTRTGAIRGKITEEQLKGLLARVSDQTTKQTTVKYDRRRAGMDDDDSDDEASWGRSKGLDDDEEDDD